jgi:hypothetical protein
VGVWKIAGRHLYSRLGHRLQILHVFVVEMEVGQYLGPAGAMPKPSQVYGLTGHESTVGQTPHGRRVPRKQDGSHLVLPPIPETVSGRVSVGEEDVDLSGAQAVQVLLPLTLRQLVVHHDVSSRSQLVTPADDDLPVDQSLVDPIEDDRHLGPGRGSSLDRLAPLLHEAVSQLAHGKVPIEDEVQEHGKIHPADDGSSLPVPAGVCCGDAAAPRP